MAAWDDVFPTTNVDGMPEWMSQSAASQLIWYHPKTDYGGDHRHPWPQVREERLLPPSGHHRSNYRVFQDPTTMGHYGSREYSVELRVPICCEGCVEKVMSRLTEVDGVRAVNVDQTQKTVMVSGTPDLKEVFDACKKIFRRSKWRPA